MLPGCFFAKARPRASPVLPEQYSEQQLSLGPRQCGSNLSQVTGGAHLGAGSTGRDAAQAPPAPSPLPPRIWPAGAFSETITGSTGRSQAPTSLSPLTQPQVALELDSYPAISLHAASA